MSQVKRETGGLEQWWAMFKSLWFVYGVPIGIGVGVVVGSILEVKGFSHSAARGLLWGAGSGALLGGVLAIWEERRKYRWVRSELTGVSNREWDAVVKALNVRAAEKHYLLVRKEGNYVAYAPTLVRPVAAGPLTISGEYLSVVVAPLNATTITITGPKYMVDAFEEAAIEVRGIAAEAS